MDLLENTRLRIIQTSNSNLSAAGIFLQGVRFYFRSRVILLSLLTMKLAVRAGKGSAVSNPSNDDINLLRGHENLLFRLPLLMF